MTSKSWVSLTKEKILSQQLLEMRNLGQGSVSALYQVEAIGKEWRMTALTSLRNNLEGQERLFVQKSIFPLSAANGGSSNGFLLRAHLSGSQNEAHSASLNHVGFIVR